MQKEISLNQILQKIPHNTVVTSVWLNQQGISNSLIHSYKKNNWFKSFGTGAYLKLNDNVELNGALYAVQTQLNLSFHIGGVSALSVHGINHNISFSRKTYIFGLCREKLPRWFNEKYNENTEIVKTALLPENVGFEDNNDKDFATKISTKERALFEMIYLAPNKSSLNEVYQLMESMPVLKPKLLQELLENCSSIKVKRVFLYIAEKLNYPWFKKLDISKVDLGKGKRTIEKGGKLDKKYNIVIGNIEEI